MIVGKTKRPRNVDAARAAAILYGDWGTSKAYVIGLVFAGAAVLAIGGLNYFGPKHTGGLAFLVSVPTAVVIILLGAFTLPQLGEALNHLKPLSGGFFANWNGFVGIVLALSGVEAIANATSVMKLNPGSSEDHQVSCRMRSISLSMLRTGIADS
jgi:amino acid transporter